MTLAGAPLAGARCSRPTLSPPAASRSARRARHRRPHGHPRRHAHVARRVGPDAGDQSRAPPRAMNAAAGVGGPALSVYAVATRWVAGALSRPRRSSTSVAIERRLRCVGKLGATGWAAPALDRREHEPVDDRCALVGLALGDGPEPPHQSPGGTHRGHRDRVRRAAPPHRRRPARPGRLTGRADAATRRQLVERDPYRLVAARGEPLLEAGAHRGPVVDDDRVHGRVAPRAVGSRLVAARRCPRTARRASGSRHANGRCARRPAASRGRIRGRTRARAAAAWPRGSPPCPRPAGRRRSTRCAPTRWRRSRSPSFVAPTTVPPSGPPSRRTVHGIAAGPPD